MLILCGIRKNCYSRGRKPLLYLFIKRAIKFTAVTLEGYKILSNILVSRLTP
jgi:hypothetical protein